MFKYTSRSLAEQDAMDYSREFAEFRIGLRKAIREADEAQCEREALARRIALYDLCGQRY